MKKQKVDVYSAEIKVSIIFAIICGVMIGLFIEEYLQFGAMTSSQRIQTIFPDVSGEFEFAFYVLMFIYWVGNAYFLRKIQCGKSDHDASR